MTTAPPEQYRRLIQAQWGHGRLNQANNHVALEEEKYGKIHSKSPCSPDSLCWIFIDSRLLRCDINGASIYCDRESDYAELEVLLQSV